MNPLVMSVVAGGGVLVLCFLLIVIGVPLYQNFWHPLARLRDTLSVGDPCESTLQSFERYVSTHPGPETSFNDSGIHQGATAEQQFADRQFGIYEIFFMDDLQLNITCDRAGRVSNILWIGD
jgi:hypothetical protein